MHPEPLSKKQIDSIRESKARLCIWEGSVRSGKTFASIIAFIKALRDGPAGNAMIVGVSRDAIQRNVLIELCTLLGFPVPTPKTTQMSIFGRTIFFVGANDDRSERKVRGSTVALAYVDEITQIPQGFFMMLLSRLSVTGAQLFGTTNPDSPFHWLKTTIIENENLEKQVWHFNLDDNPSLSENYIKNLKAEYTGLWYKRFIEGQWVLAEGTVYDFFDEQTHVIALPPGPADHYIVGVDYGTKNPTAFTMIGYSKRYFPNMWMEKEYFYDSQKHQRQKTDTDYAEDMAEFIKGRTVRSIYVDPSAASLKLEMMRQGITGIYDANHDVLNGIRFVSKLLANGTFKVCSNCKNTIREFQTYRWDEKASSKGEDKPIKENDHALDSLRYALYTALGQQYDEELTAKELDKLWSDAMGVSQELPAFFRDDQTTMLGSKF
jgi:PBSX family phage terminase large subunit